MLCPQEARGVAACAWATRYEQARNELLLAKYEAKKWKEKYLQEKKRRRKLARSLLDTMAMVGDAKRAASQSPPVRRSSSSRARTRRSSSAFSDKDQIENLLSPTLSSFDFDDDDDEEAGEDAASDAASSAAVSESKANSSADEDDEVAQLPNGHTANSDGEENTQTITRLDVRPARSSTVGSYDVLRVGRSNSWRREANTSLPPSNLLLRMLYTKSSSRDLWSTQSSRFHNVARSVVFSMQLKKEHVFEHFFVSGLDISKHDWDQAKDSPNGLGGFWKPTVLYEFAKRPGRKPDSSVADFCFPSGVPVVKCKPHQADTLRGRPVSIWTTDAEQLQRHALDPFKTSGYTFRLTGAKGEVLHGFCVAIMDDVAQPPPEANDPEAPVSPRGEWAKRASCPTASSLGLSEPAADAASFRKRQASSADRSHSSSTTQYLAPVCYCFTSKFPFYRLHFMLLRLIIENELRARDSAASVPVDPDLYEVTLTTESDLGVEFAVCRQPNIQSTPDQSTDSSSLLSSISSGPHRDKRDGVLSLSEEAPYTATSSSSTHVMDDEGHRVPVSSPPLPSRLRKSYSVSDMTSYQSPASCVVERPVIVRIAGSGACSPRLAKLLQVGDVLEAIDGVSTASLSFTEALALVQSTARPFKLRFRRLTAAHSPVPPPPPCHQLSTASTDLLQRVRRLRIGEPGAWSSLRLPDHALQYQFPKRDAERWSIGVALRVLPADTLVQLLSLLLLEKQVVITGRSSATVAAVCTACLLLLAPFQWQSTYIPQLPSSLLDFLHSPVPFLVGCQPLAATDDWPDVCFVSVDHPLAVQDAATEDAPLLPHSDEFGRLFRGARQRLGAVRRTSKPWYELCEDEDKVITLTMQEAQLFLQDICADLTSSLRLTPVQGKSFYERLQEEMAGVVRQRGAAEGFLDEFSQTQLFCQYCDTALQPERDAYTRAST